MCADDMVLLYIDDNTNDVKKHIELDLVILNTCCASNNVLINIDTTSYMIFAITNRNMEYDVDLNIYVGDKKINKLHHTRYLGLIIDSITRLI